MRKRYNLPIEEIILMIQKVEGVTPHPCSKVLSLFESNF
jgi:hypothetical protein